MFQRRLVAIGVLIAFAFTAIGARLWSLTVAEGQERLVEAEARLGRTRLLPTVRGAITDRKGRVLAEDVPAYGVAIEYTAIDGSWARDEARRLARSEIGRTAWGTLTRRGREAATERALPQAERQLDAVLDELCSLTLLPRGELDARIVQIHDEVGRRAAVVRDRQRASWIERYGDAAAGTFRPEPIREERRAHEVLPEINDATAFALRRLADEVPGIVTVTDSVRRINPWSHASVEIDRSHFPGPLRTSVPITIDLDGVADHIVGRCRTEVWRADLERRPFVRADGEEDLGGYRPGTDLIGNWGIERAQEDVLRGNRGRVTTRLDSGAEERTDPVSGRGVQLAIDVALQARVEALLDPRCGLTTRQEWHDVSAVEDESHGEGFARGTPLASAVVVIDVDLGEIVTCASWPPISANARLDGSERSRLLPSMNRAINAKYSPGSILKPIIYLAAVTEGAFPIDGTIACNGHYFPERPDVARCWIFRPRFGMTTHGALVGEPLGAEMALARSCNIFFYSLAQRLGPERLTAWLRRFGLGEPLGVGLQYEERGADGGTRLLGESAGSLPSESFIESIKTRRDALSPIILGIGQGPIDWTPVQAANAYALIAREGVVRDATLVRAPRRERTGSSGSASSNEVNASSPPSALNASNGATREDLEFSPRAVEHMLGGLRQAVEASYGTAHHIQFGDMREPMFDIPGVRIHGKTGTAQAPPLALDTDGDGTTDRVMKGLDHAWFAGLVGDGTRERPRYAIAVLVEYGGSGGKVAGPVAAQVIRALAKEGYLEPEARGDRVKGDGAGHGAKSGGAERGAKSGSAGRLP